MSNLSKAEKEALSQAWKETLRKDYLLTEKDAQALFEYLEEQLDNTGCDHTLHHTKQWLKKNLAQETIEGAIAEITEMGGYCDCEVLLNCYEDYDIG